MAWPLLVIVLAAGSFIPKFVQARDECYGPIVEVKVLGTSQAAGFIKYGVLAGFGGNLSRPLLSLRILTADPVDACGPVATPADGAALLVVRGNCTFTDKARAAQAAGAAAVLMYDNQPGCITPGYDPNATRGISLPFVSLPHDLGPRLATLAAAAAATAAGSSGTTTRADGSGDGLGSGTGSGGVPYTVQLSLRLVDVPLVDVGAALLWLLAVGTVVAGSVWSGADHLAGQRRAGGEEEEDPLLLRQQSGGKGGGSEVVDLSPRAALAFVGLASAMLLLLYFLLNKVFFFVLLAMFCLASVQSQTVLYAAGLKAVMPAGRRGAKLQLPVVGACPVAVVASLPLAVTVAAVWAVHRNQEWAWVLQDLQGVALMLLVLRTLRVPTLKVACVLLPACLLYDVFWVFIQPMLFGGGESVMVEVAQGGSSGEFIPMLLRVPHFGFGGLAGHSLLGFGDVILPGMLVAYTRRLDLDLGLVGSTLSAAVTLGGGARGGWDGVNGSAAAGAPSSLRRRAVLSYLARSYFPYTVAAYGAGLCLTYVALAFSWFGDQGQPALLYLVPCTLVTVLALAAVRRQVWALWRGEGLPYGGGFGRLATDHESDPGDGVAGSGGPCGEVGGRVGLIVSDRAVAGGGGVTGLGLGGGGEGGGDVESGRVYGGPKGG